MKGKACFWPLGVVGSVIIVNIINSSAVCILIVVQSDC